MAFRAICSFEFCMFRTFDSVEIEFIDPQIVFHRHRRKARESSVLAFCDLSGCLLNRLIVVGLGPRRAIDAPTARYVVFCEEARGFGRLEERRAGRTLNE
jgi:hypothetical protein